MTSGSPLNVSKRFRFKLLSTGSKAGVSFLMFNSLAIFNSELAEGLSEDFADLTLVNADFSCCRISESYSCASPVLAFSASFVSINSVKIAAMA